MTAPSLVDRLRVADGVAHVSSGKVRDLFAVGDDVLLLASDRISAYDCVLGSTIPDKGRVLTGLTDFWLDQLDDVVPNHRLSCDVEQFPSSLDDFANELRGRAMLCRRADVLPVECVARGYLSGSGWAEYQSSGSVCGQQLPSGLVESSALPTPLFTPATKATTGHDENVSFDAVVAQMGGAVAAHLRDATLELYSRAAGHALERGIILADTKFEFGMVDQDIVLIDEVGTPDSSRFWPEQEYQPGGAQPSFDKQYVRDWLMSSGWNREPPAPSLPQDVVTATSERYVRAYELLTGQDLATWQPRHP
jgi:phosphoribosylaminoimidazole-succinocarboxamide synthase